MRRGRRRVEVEAEAGESVPDPSEGFDPSDYSGAAEPEPETDADRVLAMAHTPPLDEIEVIGFEEVTEVKGGNVSSAGFAKLVKGWEFVGYLHGETVVESQFVDPATGEKKQRVIVLAGSARWPSTEVTNTTVEVKGKIRIPRHASLVESLKEIQESPAAQRGERVYFKIKYLGQAPHRKNEQGNVVRSGRQQYDVRLVKKSQ